MGKVIAVTPETLEQASNTLADLAVQYNEIYTQLKQQAATMGAAWEGEDNLEFVNKITEFCDTNLKFLADNLSEASATLNQQRRQYVTRQEANKVNVGKLTV